MGRPKAISLGRPLSYPPMIKPLPAGVPVAETQALTAPGVVAHQMQVGPGDDGYAHVHQVAYRHLTKPPRPDWRGLLENVEAAAPTEAIEVVTDQLAAGDVESAGLQDHGCGSRRFRRDAGHRGTGAGRVADTAASNVGHDICAGAGVH